MVRDDPVRGLHAAQMSRDVGSHNEAGKLPGEKIKREERDHDNRKTGITPMKT